MRKFLSASPSPVMDALWFAALLAALFNIPRTTATPSPKCSVGFPVQIGVNSSASATLSVAVKLESLLVMTSFMGVLGCSLANLATDMPRAFIDPRTAVPDSARAIADFTHGSADCRPARFARRIVAIDRPCVSLDRSTASADWPAVSMEQRPVSIVRPPASFDFCTSGIDRMKVSINRQMKSFTRGFALLFG